MKYDLYEDNILVKSHNALLLDQNRIDSFKIDKKKFIKIDNIVGNDFEMFGFYEIVLKTSLFSFFKKHRKTRKKLVNNKTVYYEFNSENEYYLLRDRIYTKVRRKEDILKVFPKYKKEINNNLKKSFLNLDNEAYTIAVLNRINTLITKESITIKK